MAFDAFMAFKDSKTGNWLQGETQTEWSKSNEVLATSPSKLSDAKPFEIDDFSFDIENVLNIGSASGGVGAGKVTFNPLSFSRKIDKASPDFFRKCCNGTHFSEVILALRKQTGSEASGEVFLRFDFRVVGVKTVEWSGSDGDEAVKESVTLEYGAIQIRYAAQESGGKLTTPIPASWDRIRNVEAFPA
jgi:type VI secretion system secreted protein Hcp